ncbi:hypothetical protein [Tropicimonas sp. IMCC34043]|uniref:hypothetical protein n=1 Tax=Tropicimonas sp. IMCC34043 TaxID=2248760 RepID=UPI00130042BF|nr:hypothetical protein [Tropicimonas sp. IMCC34043]
MMHKATPERWIFAYFTCILFVLTSTAIAQEYNVGTLRNCAVIRDCTSTIDCNRRPPTRDCTTKLLFGIRYNDPACEAARAAEKSYFESQRAQCEASKAAARLDCERLKSQEKLQCEAQRAVEIRAGEQFRRQVQDLPLGTAIPIEAPSFLQDGQVLPSEEAAAKQWLQLSVSTLDNVPEAMTLFFDNIGIFVVDGVLLRDASVGPPTAREWIGAMFLSSEAERLGGDAYFQVAATAGSKLVNRALEIIDSTCEKIDC